MELHEIDPTTAQIDPRNERNEVDTDSDSFTELVESIEEVGVTQPPLARKADDGTFQIVVGQRRTLAAREAGVDAIPVIEMPWNDEAALKASITENVGLFRNEVSTRDRADALQALWHELGGEGMPVQSQLSDELGIPRSTIRTWLEPLHEGWKDTSIDPRSTSSSSDDEDGDDFFTGNGGLGERSLADIRRMTGGGEDGEAVAKEAAENDLSQEEIAEAKELVEEADADPYEAIDEMAADEDAEDTSSASTDPHIEAEVTFDSTASVGLKNYASRTDQDPGEVVSEAVRWFLREEGELPDDDSDDESVSEEPDKTPEGVGYEVGEPASTNGSEADSSPLSEKL